VLVDAPAGASLLHLSTLAGFRAGGAVRLAAATPHEEDAIVRELKPSISATDDAAGTMLLWSAVGHAMPRGTLVSALLPGEQYTDDTTSRPFHYPPLVAAADPPAVRPEARGLALTEQLDNHPVRRRPPRPSRRSARPPRPHPSSSDALFTTARAAGTPPLPPVPPPAARPSSPTPQI
jgi:hypothetical protein